MEVRHVLLDTKLNLGLQSLQRIHRRPFSIGLPRDDLGWSILKRPLSTLPPKNRTVTQESSKVSMIELMTQKSERTFKVLVQGDVHLLTRTQLLKRYPDEYLAYLNEKLLAKSLKALSK
jgi:hypothetical protein